MCSRIFKASVHQKSKLAMEAVKATLPRRLLQEIGGSDVEALESTCDALVAHLSSNRTCSQLLVQLTDPEKTSCAKDAATALQCKHEGNDAFGASSFRQALGCYTKALRYAPLCTNADATIAATLLVNRAAASHALGLLTAAARDCTRAIELQPSYAKAWYRRGRVQAGLRSYAKARVDLKQALALETSAGGRNQISAELVKLENAASRSPPAAAEQDDSDEPGALSRRWEPGASDARDGVCSHWTPEKHWGLRTEARLDAGSLVLEEEPYAAIILKGYRDTHCHFCFELLPADPVTCTGCFIPSYCTELCQSAACGDGGRELQGRGEHAHECGGASWSAALPPDAVLATRMLARSQRNKGLDKQLDELCHHYDKMSGEDKVDLQVLAAVVAHCFSSSALFNGAHTVGSLAAKLVCLIAQVRANAMAIVSVYSPAEDPSSFTTDPRKGQTADFGTDGSMLCSVEQVKVAQAVYAVGSKLNHSCDPNVHASFKKRHLRVRTIVPVSSGSPLELCYGPQVGETGRDERQAWLRERYFFTCTCPACTAVTPSELLLFAFRCPSSGCDGVVPGPASPPPPNVTDLPAAGPSPEPGRCSSCGAAVDMKRATTAAKATLKEFQRVQSELRAPHVNHEFLVRGALDVLGRCRDVFHASCKETAKAEDLVAQVFCSVGRPHDAVPHCKSEIQILEKIYNKDHIAVANERLKMASVALAAGDVREARKGLASVDRAMTVHYGPDYRAMSPFCDGLHRALERASA